MKYLRSICRFFPGFAFLAVIALPAFAVEVQYRTFGTFACNGLAGCVVTNNYLGVAGDSRVVLTSGANSSAIVYTHGFDDFTDAGDPTALTTNFNGGTLTPTGTGSGAALSAGGLSVTLDIQVVQSIPTPEVAADFVGTVTGKITSGADTLKIAFAPPAITLSQVDYTLDNPQYVIAKGGTTVQGTLDATALPEPAFFTLTGIGFFGMFGIAWSRYKQQRG